MGWIDKYLRYTEQQVSPRVFHFWTAVSVLGGVMGRKIVLQVGEDRYIYPGQVLVVLVSKSAVTKKTTAAGMGVKLLGKLEPWQVYVLPRKLSPQSLLFGLQRMDNQEGEKKEPMRDPDGKRVHSTGFLFAGELGVMFTSEPFAEALAGHINELNDAPPGLYPIEFRSWKAELWKPCVGGIGCITPKGLARELPKVARTAGFFGRLIIVEASYTDRAVALLDEPPKLSKQLREELVAELKEIARQKGKVNITKEARQWEKHWYHDVYLPWIKGQDFPENEQSGYWQRKESHMLRVGIILMRSESPNLDLRVHHLEQALKELERLEQGFPRAFAEMHTSPYTDYDTNLIQELERMAGTEWIAEAKLRKVMLNQGGDRRFNEARDTLKAAGEVEVRRTEKDSVWRRIYSTGRMLRATRESKDEGQDEE